MRTQHIFALLLLFSNPFSGQASLTNVMVLVAGKPALVPGLNAQQPHARVTKLHDWLRTPVKISNHPFAGASYNPSCIESLQFPLNPLDVFVSHLFPDRQNAVPNQRGVEPLNNITPNHLKNVMQALVQASQGDTVERANLFNQLAQKWKVKLSSVQNFAEFYSENREFWQYLQQKVIIERHVDSISFWNLHKQTAKAIMLWAMRWVHGRENDALSYERAVRFFTPLKDHPDGMHYVHNTSEDIMAFNQKRMNFLEKSKSDQEKFAKAMLKLSCIDSMVEAFADAENRQKVLELWDLFAWSKLKNEKDVAEYLGAGKKDSIQILGLEEFKRLQKEFSADEEAFWQWSALHKQLYIVFASQNTAFKPPKYNQARVDDTTFSDCVETALFNVITHAIAEKREGIIYLNRDRLNQGTPAYRYLEEFSDMAANLTERARDHRANMIANLPANLGVSYSKDGCELYSSASTFANAMIYLLGLADQHHLSERASQAQIKETYDAIGGHLGVTFKFEGEIVTLLRGDSALGNLQIIHGNHIEYTVWDTLEDESSFSDLFGKVKKYEDALALAGVADADSYLKLQKAVRDFDQALTPSQNVQIYQAFAQQALSNDARILAAYEGFRILPKRPEIFPDRSNKAKKEREVVLRAVQSIMKELSDANDPATIKKLHEHINLNYMQGHMKFISPAEFVQIISAAPNLFRLIDRREPKAPKEELLTKLNIRGTADADATSWNVLPDGKFGDLMASMAGNIFSTRDIFDGYSYYAYDALVCNCHTLYVNPDDYDLNYAQFTNSKTIGFDPRLASGSYMFSKSNRFIEANPIEVRLLGLAHVDTLVQEFLPSLVKNESHRFKMLSLGDNTLSYNPFEVEKGNTTFSSVVEWLVPNNHKPRTTYGGLVHSFITEAFRVMPDDKVINIGFTQTSEKLDEVMKYATTHHWPLERLRVEVWHSEGDKVSGALEDAYYKNGVKDRDAPVFKTFSGGFAEEERHFIERWLSF